MTDLKENQNDLIQRFEAAFNSIDRELRNRTGQNDDKPFFGVTRDYELMAKGWSHGNTLRRIAKLRNAIVHDKVEPYNYPAIPTESVIEKLEAIKRSLTSPKTAYSEFRRSEVVKVYTHQTLEEVLKEIYQRDFSQFPVYDGSRFVGLLTENGITRWLADYAQNRDSILLLTDTAVQDVLEKEERRSNFVFVARSVTLDEVTYAFGTKPNLEAVLVTENGKEHEKLLGIATRWDLTSKSV